MRILYLPNEFSQQRQREKKANIYPVLMAMQAQWYRNQGHQVFWGEQPQAHDYDRLITKPEGLPFLSLPAPDRVWSQAKRYTSGNYKYYPGTHMQVANGCWHGKCTFCVEQKNTYEIRKVEDVINEIIDCKHLGFKEIFDDSGTFPTGTWLNDFCEKKMIFAPHIVMGCNMRMVDIDYKLLKKAGFRMVLFGLESANQGTLDKIQKGTKVDDIKYIVRAREAGLEPHVAVMFGYPWESDSDTENTLQVVHTLLQKGYACTAQGSVFCDGSGSCDRTHERSVRRIYDVAKTPSFWATKIKACKNKDDIKYLWKQIKVGLKEWR